MTPGTARPRPSRVLLLRGAAALAALLIVATLAGRSLPSPTGPAGTVAPASAQPGVPSAAAEAWAKVTLPPFGAVADIAPTKSIGRNVATTTAFTRRSLGQASRVELASRVTADPPVKFAIEPGASGADATITPTGALEPATRYRFRLAAS